jgi:hypothetical protein
MADLTGGCLCGRVRYTVHGDPVFSGLCHCRNCQRYTGSAFETLMGFPVGSVSVQGELKTYDNIGDSGRTLHRRFCPNCGSGVVAEADLLPGLIFVLAGTLDDPAAFKPITEMYWSKVQPWIRTSGERTRFPEMPN